MSLPLPLVLAGFGDAPAEELVVLIFGSFGSFGSLSSLGSLGSLGILSILFAGAGGVLTAGEEPRTMEGASRLTVGEGGIELL